VRTSDGPWNKTAQRFVLLNKYDSVDQMKENEIDRACSTYGVSMVKPERMKETTSET
jgi:hypothetical protein